MRRLSKDHVCGAMSRDERAVMRVAAGETFCVETEDCYAGCLKRPGDETPKEMGGFANPATGPVFIEGAEPGDILRIEIESVAMRDYAVMRVSPGQGALGDSIEEEETVFLPIRDGMLQIREGLHVPVRPMIGVIGVAPAGEPVPTITPGEHGGNMDCREIGPGAVLYLPVNVEGALLAMGDLHAVMGDGEVCICGAEVSGEVVLHVDATHSALPTPCVETPEHVLFLGSAVTLDECEAIVVDKALRFLTGACGLATHEAARLMSLVGELRVCQVVDPLKTMKFMLPRSVLAGLGVESLTTAD